MKQIKDLTVKVTYEVGLGDVEMPKKVYKQLLRASERGDDIEMNSMKYSTAESWLNENITERDCMEWKAEIIELREANFIKISPNIDVKVPAYFEEEREVDVKINLRVSDDGFIYFGPMECSGSIHKHKTMFELQSEFIKSYEKQGYKFVQIKEVFIDKDFFTEYKEMMVYVSLCPFTGKPLYDDLENLKE